MMNLLWSTKTIEEAKCLIEHGFEYFCAVEDGAGMRLASGVE